MLRVSDLVLGYGQEPVVEGVNLEVAGGKFVSLVGPSGSGKTSILRAIDGLLTPRSGRVELNGSRETVAFLFQDDALLP
ncbi:MAG TPA: ATP-binding cassette domain-containing protein, partial [Candidatus Binatia bacterium]|nr:ATP-binding cassette domain-containing protein [Candidatus Binatia bacterium]